jgi:hypothetical protein
MAGASDDKPGGAAVLKSGSSDDINSHSGSIILQSYLSFGTTG